MECTGGKRLEKGGRGMGKMIKILVPLQPYIACIGPLPMWQICRTVRCNDTCALVCTCWAVRLALAEPGCCCDCELLRLPSPVRCTGSFKLRGVCHGRQLHTALYNSRNNYQGPMGLYIVWQYMPKPINKTEQSPMPLWALSETNITSRIEAE